MADNNETKNIEPEEILAKMKTFMTAYGVYMADRPYRVLTVGEVVERDKSILQHLSSLLGVESQSSIQDGTDE